MKFSNSAIITLKCIESVALFVSLINTFVFSCLRGHGILYKRLLVISCIDLTYLSLALVTYFSDYFYQNLYSSEPDEKLRINAEFCYISACLFIREYLVQVLIVLGVFMEIWVTSIRIGIVTHNGPYSPTATYRLVIGFTVLLLASIALHAPLLFMKRVELTNVMGNDHHYYHEVQTEFGKTRTSLILQMLVILVRVMCTSVVLVTLNIIAIWMYWSFLHRKPESVDLKCIKSDFLPLIIIFFPLNLITVIFPNSEG
jgi:hypothetical protein